ncbi:hypothetical protein [Fusobacterium gastrosuis]|uniref:hypothetical protein n=1 Tax=Fusobacterium gastrosuis TaxID=1755100 RepID=UPI002A928F91|nr:hypothetical protein [Fusobacterium gastrosuis]
MSKYAYKDIKRTQKIYANAIKVEDNHTWFYCPNIECNARLTLRANSSIKNITPYFSALKTFPHIDDCFCKEDNFSYDEVNYNENLFDFEKIAEGYSLNQFVSIPRRLETISAIYYMCKSKSINDTYNGIEIWRILADNRSNSIYKNGIFRYHIIECYYSHYSSEKLLIHLNYPLNNDLSNKYRIVLSFSDENLFKEIRNKIYNNLNQKFPLLVLTFWRYDGKNIKGRINNSAQIYFRK